MSSFTYILCVYYIWSQWKTHRSSKVVHVCTASLILRGRYLAESVLVRLSLFWNSYDTINTSFFQMAKWTHNSGKFPSVPKSSVCLNISAHQNEKKRHHQPFTSGHSIVYAFNTCLVTAKMLHHHIKMFFHEVLKFELPHYLSVWSTTDVHHAKHL